jgi:signal peptidase I
MPEGKMRWKPWVRTLLRSVAFVGLSLGLAVVLFHFTFQPFQVAGLSMAPCLNDRDYLLVDRVFFRGSGLGRGDLVVFRIEGDPRFMVKRLVGLPGEVLSSHDGVLTVNDRALTTGFFRNAAYPDFGPVKVPEGCFFCVGDNPAVSLDSRTFGPIRQDSIYGRPVLRYLPLTRSGLLTGQGSR